MSVEPSEAMSEVWTRWQGHVINGVFPLGRFLGGSDHSGVFLTRSAALGASEVAVKLVPTSRALAESQLPRWKRAGGLTHAHLLRLLEWGGCQLDGLPYLYVVMEYADQTLAQLLHHRALTDDEAREMLPPVLDALVFLHGRNLVQGQLKPANILVVGDQLKLASDTIRRVSDGTMSADTLTVYDPPEARHGSQSTASDVWALGISLFEALTRRAPAALGEHGEAVVLPAGFSPAFREVVSRCLSPSPHDRPTVTQLATWARTGAAEFVPAPIPQPEALVAPDTRTAEPAPPRSSSVEPESAAPAQRVPSMPQPPKRRGLLSVWVAAAVILALGWAGVHILRTDRTPAPPPVQARAESPAPTRGVSGPAAVQAPVAPVSSVSATAPGRSEAAASPAALHEVIPDVPPRADRTIRGHIKVWVRVIVGQDGSVVAALADRAGPSRYFERLAIDAAKKWTFPPADTASRRLMQIRFDFSRGKTTAHAVTLP